MQNETKTYGVNKTAGNIFDVPCLECKRSTKHKVLASGEESFEYRGADGSFCAYTDHQIVQCQGCETVSFRVLSENSEDIDYSYDEDGNTVGTPVQTTTLYPSRNEGRGVIKDDYLLPSNIQRIYKETINAFNNQQPVLSGMGIRALVETICKDKQAKGKDLFNKINDLVTIGVLTSDGATILHKIRTLGNDAAHEVKPHKFEQLSLAMDVCEHLLQGVYILPEHAKETFN